MCFPQVNIKQFEKKFYASHLTQFTVTPFIMYTICS